MIRIDQLSFDLSVERLSFPLGHMFADPSELAKLRLLARLTSANFAATNLDDRGLAHVASAATIEQLDLQDTKITDDGISCLAGLPRLAYLRLKDNPQLTNACIPRLVRIAALTELQIHETSIDQAGVNDLVTMRGLKQLCVDIGRDRFTFKGLLELSARMPRCTILAKGRGEFCNGTFDGTWQHG